METPPLPKATLDYLESGASEGQRNTQLFAAACQLRDAGYPVTAAEDGLLNRAVSDGLGEREVIATIRSAYGAVPREPITPGRKQLTYVKSVDSKPVAARRQYDLTPKADFKLPEPKQDGARELLRHAFKPGEGINIVPAVLDGNGDERPDTDSYTLSYEAWMQKLDAYEGKPNGFLRSGSRTGIYICINPVSFDGRKDANVTDFRHALVEFDTIPIEAQWQLIVQSRIPCTAVVHSGGRSLHAWVRVDAKDRKDYDARVKALYEHFANYKLDQQNKNPSRLCRLPNCERFGKQQELLALQTGVRDFTEWLALQELDGIGHQLTVDELIDFRAEDDSNSLLGNRWLCRGGSCLWIGQSGIGKSSLAMQAAILWGLGRAMYGIAPKRPLRSLIVQAENDLGDLAEMFQGVCAGLSITAGSDSMTMLKENIVIYRDTIHTGHEFTQIVQRLYDKHKPDLAWGDPLLSYMGDDISQQKACSQFLRHWCNPISEATGLIWMFLHHTGKPPQDPKSRTGWKASDFSYLGIGSSELVNWARAVNVVMQVDETTFKLALAKRGKRAGATDLQGKPAQHVYIRHGETGICWQQVEYVEPVKGRKQTEPSKHTLSRSYDWHGAAKLIKDMRQVQAAKHVASFLDLEPSTIEKKKWHELARYLTYDRKTGFSYCPQKAAAVTSGSPPTPPPPTQELSF